MKKSFYWGVMDRNREWASCFLPRQKDAKDYCYRWNTSLKYDPFKNPRFTVKRFQVILKGKRLTEIDLYEHEYVRTKTKIV